jgi:peptide/nickel transport system permease protein
MLLRYALRRLLMAIPLLFGISILTFALLHLTPGNPVQAETSMNPHINPDSIRALRELYGMNDPLPVQYMHWLGRLVHLNFGLSNRDQQPVIDSIWASLPATLLLNVASLTLMLAIGIPFGVRAATKPNSSFTKIFSAFSFAAYSFPDFWLALLLQLSIGAWLGLLPISGFTSAGAEDLSWAARVGDLMAHLVLPLIVSTFGAWAVLSRYIRNNMFEALNQDYIRTARAKGLSERAVFWRHALPNALLPVVTILGLAIPGLISGSVIIESIFAWPGLGRLFYVAATSYDYPMVMGLSFVGAILTVLGNLVADVAQAALDPRIKVS